MELVDFKLDETENILPTVKYKSNYFDER